MDVVVAALFATGVMVHLWYFPVIGSASHAITARGVLAPLYLAATVPIALRRRYPVTVMVVIAVAVALATTLGHSLAPAPLLAIPLYTLATSHPRRTSLTALVGVELSIGTQRLDQIPERTRHAALALGAKLYLSAENPGVADLASADLGGIFTASDLRHLPPFTGAVRMRVHGQATPAFSLHVAKEGVWSERRT